MPVPTDYRELSGPMLRGRSVEALWSFRPSSAGEHLVLPDGRMDLVARYHVDARDTVRDLHLAIVGPSQKPFRVPMEAHHRWLGVRFRAGWGASCFGVDASGLRDVRLSGADLDRVLGDRASTIRAVGTEDELQAALLSASRSGRHRLAAEVVAAIDLLHLSGGRLSLSQLARATGMSERSVRRRVGEAVGLPIQSLAGVLRFQRTARLLAQRSGSGFTLVQAALEGGYSDQPHMTREFRRYGGFTPGRAPPLAFGSLPLATWPNSSR